LDEWVNDHLQAGEIEIVWPAQRDEVEIKTGLEEPSRFDLSGGPMEC